ncbi:MAG: hypothetical protein QOF02_2772 [Blastocatellia bacterium]|jgi:hypothetical protein|nr:hypothetical protein [Blastocatellia bacterium]
MRLLAYGGTSYNERQRIGVWGDISRGALEDTYGLPEQMMIYGLGVLDEQPFLVVRQRQLTETGRAYAFSLLLDPGSDVWERFRWNAAALACALFDGADSLGQSLFDRPESFNEEELAQSLDELQPPPAPVRAVENDSDFLACWSGAPLSSVPVMTSPQSLGFAARPSPREIFERIAALPRCLQIGLGWLVGGSRESAQAFGSCLVLDDSAHGAQEAEEAARACIADGRRLLGAWQTIAADEEFAPALARLAALPLWQWDAAGTLAPAAMLERIVFLADLINPPPSVEPLLQSLKKRLEGSQLLAKEIRRAAHRLALAGDEPLNSARTSILLDNHFDEGLAIPESAFRRLHREMLIQFFVGRALPPGDDAQRLQLAPELRREIWVRLLGAAKPYDKLPSLLREAADDEVAAGGSQESLARFDSQLLEAVRTQTAVSGASLLVWNEFPREHPIWPGLRVTLMEEALQRALRKSREWRIEYLLYGQDPGGNVLHGKGLEAQDATLLVKFYRDEVRDEGAQAESAARWLAALAESSLRREVSVRDKLEVAKFVGGQWQLLIHLWRLYYGNRSMYDLTEPSVFSLNSPLQRKLLRNELTQMISELPVIDFTPDLRGLVEFLEELPPDAIKYFLRLRPRLTAGNYEGWIGGWKALDVPNRMEEETVRLILESDEAVQKVWLFRGFSEPKLETMFYKLLFGGTGQDDERYRAKLSQLLAREGSRSKLGEATKRAFINGHQDRECMRVFTRRFAGHAAPLDRLFRCLTIHLQSRVVEALVSRDIEAFSDEVYNIYVSAQRDGNLLTLYERAMLRYLTYPDGKGIKRMVARSAHLSLGAKIVDDNIDEIMSRPTVRLEGDDEDEETAESADVVEDNPAPPDEAASDALDETPAPRVRHKPQGASGAEDSPSLFGRAWGFMKSLVTQPELDEDGAGDTPSSQGDARETRPRDAGPRDATASSSSKSSSSDAAPPLVARPSEDSEGRAGSLASSPDEARPGSAPVKDNRA